MQLLQTSSYSYILFFFFIGNVQVMLNRNVVLLSTKVYEIKYKVFLFGPPENDVCRWLIGKSCTDMYGRWKIKYHPQKKTEIKIQRHSCHIGLNFVSVCFPYWPNAYKFWNLCCKLILYVLPLNLIAEIESLFQTFLQKSIIFITLTLCVSCR